MRIYTKRNPSSSYKNDYKTSNLLFENLTLFFFLEIAISFLSMKLKISDWRRKEKRKKKRKKVYI
jgi:hypothetical protein